MIKDKFEKNPMMLSGLQLAYIGDCVYEILVKSHIIENYDYSVNEMHKVAVEFVKAEFQSKIVIENMEFFSEEEISIIKRGRNSKINSLPKNTSLMEYKYATGFEALIGFLYMKDEYNRIHEIFDMILLMYERK